VWRNAANCCRSRSEHGPHQSIPSLIAQLLRVTRARVKGIIVVLLKERIQELDKKGLQPKGK
jgi:hypothetical protein